MTRRIVKPVAIFAVSRLVNLTALVVSKTLTPPSTMGEVFRRWDGAWYVATAQFGYPDTVPEGDGAQSTISFFPAFPMLMRLADRATGAGLVVSGVVIVAIAGAVAAVAFHRLTAHLRDDDTADRATALLCFFPGTIALSLVYAEALALLAVVASCYWLVREKWVLAGLAGAIATATRPNTLGIVVAAAVAAYLANRRHRSVVPFAAPILSIGGVGAFVLYLWARTGRADALVVSQRTGWRGGFSPGQSVVDLADYLREPTDTGRFVIAATIVFSVASIVVLVRSKLPLPLVVYGVVTLLIGMTTIGHRPRFALLAFPIFIAWAARVRPAVHSTLVGASAVLLGTYTVLMTNPGYPSP